MSAKVVLKVSKGEIQGKEIQFDSHDTVICGRAPDCNVILKEAAVSRHHFILEVNPPDMRIRDLGSRNGTIVNGTKYGGRDERETPEEAKQRAYPQVDLTDGDQVSVGNVTIDVSVITPATCCQCGVEIPDDDKNAEWMQGSYMCQMCRGVMDTPALSIQTRPPTMVELLRCSQCDKDVAGEIGNRRQGNYVCNACRAKIMSNESGGVRAILQQAAKERAGETKPTVAGYTIGKELARGGMGCVFAATRDADNVPFVVKVMLSPIAVERVAVDRFHREISLTKKLNHENIVGFIDDGVAGSIFYFIMEFCNSGDLAQFAFQRGGILPLKVCLPIMLQCLRGLEHAHVEGVVHRDLKPANVLLHQIENKYVAKISDFGLAKSFDASGLSGLTATGSGGGTMPYMPREQLTQFKDVRPASDVWSFAATFYTILTGRLPRAASETADPLQVILEVDATPIRQHLPSLPDAVAAVFDQALLSDTSRRYQDGGELRRALRKAVS